MEVQKVNILHLARFIINYYRANKDRAATNLELQKILYYLQAYHLVKFDGHPFFDDIPEAWVRGPVYRTVYNCYRGYGSDEIDSEDGSPVQESYEASLKELQLNEDQVVFMDSALKYFTNMSYGELITRTHAEKPWNEARAGLGPLDYSHEVISHDMMSTYYKKIVEKNQKRKSES